MCGDRENNCNSCISEILRKIIVLQSNNYNGDCFIGCDKPYLGPTPTAICYNTRPITLYNCCSGNPWTFDYTLANCTTGTTSLLRVESLDDCCCTCRLLYTNSEGTTLSTGQFVTIDLNCCGAIRCFTDTSVDLC